MIDWLKFTIPCFHEKPIYGDSVLRVTREGEKIYEHVLFLKYTGSYDSSLLIRTSRFNADGTGSELVIDGNPVKFLQGHNLFGTRDLIGLVCCLMYKLAQDLDFNPTAKDIRNWHEGNFKLSRVDTTSMFALDSVQSVRSWLYSAERSCHLRNRGRGVFSGSTLYFGKNSRRWSLKFYGKYDEIFSKSSGHEIPAEIITDELVSYAEVALRAEVCLRAIELKDRKLELGKNWKKINGVCQVDEIMKITLENLKFSDAHRIPDDILKALSPALKSVYLNWLNGEDMKDLLPKATFYKYRKILLSHGVDIAIRQPYEEKPDNVIPLVRILEAVPMGIPDFAIGTSLYFDPSVELKKYEDSRLKVIN